MEYDNNTRSKIFVLFSYDIHIFGLSWGCAGDGPRTHPTPPGPGPQDMLWFVFSITSTRVTYKPLIWDHPALKMNVFSYAELMLLIAAPFESMADNRRRDMARVRNRIMKKGWPRLLHIGTVVGEGGE